VVENCPPGHHEDRKSTKTPKTIDLPLDVVGNAIASTPLEKYIDVYEASRKR
jgi:hypothetical protein